MFAGLCDALIYCNSSKLSNRHCMSLLHYETRSVFTAFSLFPLGVCGFCGYNMLGGCHGYSLFGCPSTVTGQIPLSVIKYCRIFKPHYSGVLRSENLKKRCRKQVCEKV
jgi:hypothetical protein